MNTQEQITTLETRVDSLQTERDALKIGLHYAEIVIEMQRDRMAEYKSVMNQQASAIFDLEREQMLRKLAR